MAGFLELPSGSMVLPRPSSGHGWAEVMPEELILGAGTKQFIFTHMMALFSPQDPQEPQQDWGGELRPRVRRTIACTRLSSCSYILKNRAQGTRVAASAYAGHLTMGQDSGRCCLLDPGWASVQDGWWLPWPPASQDGFPLVKGPHRKA